MGSPNYQELVDRIAQLEARQLTLKDLPLKALQNSLEQNWQPNASLLLGAGSLTRDMLSDLAFDWGSISLPFVASATSAAVAQTHRLKRDPVIVLYEIADLNIDAVVTTAHDASSFTAQARYTGAVTGTAIVRWLAIG